MNYKQIMDESLKLKINSSGFTYNLIIKLVNSFNLKQNKKQKIN
jgi:hypothetical protein